MLLHNDVLLAAAVQNAAPVVGHEKHSITVKRVRSLGQTVGSVILRSVSVKILDP